jgi:hypothetical protein
MVDWNQTYYFNVIKKLKFLCGLEKIALLLADYDV